MFIEDFLPKCFVNITTSMEDVIMSNCFRRHGVVTADTRDNTGACRYHAKGADYQGRLKSNAKAPWRPIDMQQMFGFRYKGGLDGVSKQSVAFHAKGEAKLKGKYGSGTLVIDRMYRYHAILYGLCGYDLT